MTLLCSMLGPAISPMREGDVAHVDFGVAQAHLPTTISVDRIVESTGQNVGAVALQSVVRHNGQMRETGLVIEVPEATATVAHWREHHDPIAGMPNPPETGTAV